MCKIKMPNQNKPFRQNSKKGLEGMNTRLSGREGKKNDCAKEEQRKEVESRIEKIGPKYEKGRKNFHHSSRR